jgi:hypothetical protein
MEPLISSVKVVGVLAEIRTGHHPNSNKFYHVNPFLRCEKLKIIASRMEIYNISVLRERQIHHANCDLFTRLFTFNIQCTYKDNAILLFYFVKTDFNRTLVCSLSRTILSAVILHEGYKF